MDKICKYKSMATVVIKAMFLYYIIINNSITSLLTSTKNLSTSTYLLNNNKMKNIH